MNDEPTSRGSSTGVLSILRRTWRLGARLDVAAALILVVLLVAALGSCFPQLSPTVAADPQRLAQWQAGIRAKYGPLAQLLTTSGVFRCFRSPVFLVPLLSLVIATLACTLDRWRGLWRRVFRRPVRCSDAVLHTAPHTASLLLPAATSASDASDLVRDRLERRGFRVGLQTDGDTLHLRGDRYWWAPLATLVTHLAALLLLLGATLSSLSGWREELAVGPGEMARLEHRRDLTLRHEGFTVERYPDGSVAGYQADVTVTGGWGTKRGSIRVNQPLDYGAISFHLRSYEGTEGSYTFTLLAVYDPGCGVVIAGGLLLLLGLTVSFNFPHCRVHARVEPDGTLSLAAWADRRAWGFERELAGLADELKQVAQC